MRIEDLDVDDVLFEFLERCQRISAPRSGELIDDSGFTFAQFCACGSVDRIQCEIELEEAPGVPLTRWICAQCDSLWIFSEGQISIREVSVPKGGGLDEALYQIERLRLALFLLTKWEERLYLQIFLWDNVRDRTRIAKLANRRWRTSKWTEWKVRQTISGAQKKIHHALKLKARARTNPNWTLEDHKR